MKLFTTLLAISFLVFSKCEAQDLVLMHKGDSLNCTITSVDEQFIHATLKQGNEDKKILLSHSLVKYFEYNYYLKPTSERTISKKEEVRDDYVFNRNK